MPINGADVKAKLEQLKSMLSDKPEALALIDEIISEAYPAEETQSPDVEGLSDEELTGVQGKNLPMGELPNYDPTGVSQRKIF